MEKEISNIQKADEYTTNKAKRIYDFFENHSDYNLFVKNPAHRSKTIIVIEGEEDFITKTKAKALENGIVLGNGYRNPRTFRIANFLSHTESDLEKLFSCLRN
jgi:phosphoserine aminotransferase